MLDEKTKELIAVGASITANCHPCIKYHVGKAREMEIAEDEIQQAIEVGKMADLVIVNGNPLENITILEDISNLDYVIKDGVIMAKNGLLVST